MHLFTMQHGLDGAVLDVPEDVLGPSTESFFGEIYKIYTLFCTAPNSTIEIIQPVVVRQA